MKTKMLLLALGAAALLSGCGVGPSTVVNPFDWSDPTARQVTVLGSVPPNSQRVAAR